MLEDTQKVSKSYSLNPVVIAWVMQKAARLTYESNGERTSDSKVVNDILTAAMLEDIVDQEVSHAKKIVIAARKQTGGKS